MNSVAPGERSPPACQSIYPRPRTSLLGLRPGLACTSFTSSSRFSATSCLRRRSSSACTARGGEAGSRPENLSPKPQGCAPCSDPSAPSASQVLAARSDSRWGQVAGMPISECTQLHAHGPTPCSYPPNFRVHPGACSDPPSRDHPSSAPQTSPAMRRGPPACPHRQRSPPALHNTPPAAPVCPLFMHWHWHNSWRSKCVSQHVRRKATPDPSRSALALPFSLRPRVAGAKPPPTSTQPRSPDLPKLGLFDPSSCKSRSLPRPLFSPALLVPWRCVVARRLRCSCV